MTCNASGKGCVGVGNGIDDVCTAHYCYAPDALQIERNARQEKKRLDRGCSKSSPMTDLTDDEIKKLRTLCNATTKGPWRHQPDVGRVVGKDAVGLDDEYVASVDWTPDAAFIIAARDALPSLLAEVERLRELVGMATCFKVDKVAIMRDDDSWWFKGRRYPTLDAAFAAARKEQP